MRNKRVKSLPHTSRRLLPAPAAESAYSRPPNALHIEYVLLNSLKPSPNNPRRHSRKQIAALAQSLREFGWVRPIVLDAANTIVAGHALVEAGLTAGYEEAPVIRASHLTEAQLRAFRIADNKLGELSAWDPPALAVEMRYLLSVDFNLELTGFAVPEVDVILSDNEEADIDARAEDVPDISDAPVSRPGDLWLLDRHRLLCGNALEPEAYMQLMGGRKAQMVITDPPWNVPVHGHIGGLGSIRHREFVMGSGELSRAEFHSFLLRAAHNMADNSCNGSLHFIFMDWRQGATMYAVGSEVYSEQKALCVWAKPTPGMGSLFRSSVELVFVYKNGTAPHINNIALGKYGRNRTNLWRYVGATGWSKGRRERLALHPTSKPVAMIADAMRDCSKRSGVVLDPFAGSGTLFIAAAQTGRIGYGMDLDPGYVDVAVRRWESYTGKRARHAETGQTFAEIRAQRLGELAAE